MASYVIDEILKARKVTDYLAKKGHHPVGGAMNGKLKYRCPLHKGDKTPSFMVFQNGEFENYFCFGCKARYHIVHLYRDMEGVSTKEAIKALANGLELDVDAEIAHAVRHINEDRSLLQEHNVVEMSLILNRQIYDFLKEVNHERSCTASAEKLFGLIDQAVATGDVLALKSLEEPMSDAILHKVRWYRDLQEQRIMSAAKQNEE